MNEFFILFSYHKTIMKNYKELLHKVLETGADREGRNGWTRGLFTEQLRFSMKDGFPAVTTKKLAFKTMVAELLCFISGCNDNRVMQRLGCNIWTANAEAEYWKPKAKFEGDLGRIYGVQWRHWRKPDGTEVDQLASIIERIKKDPNDRRLIITAWNPGELEEMALPPCHMIFQFFVINGKLSLHMFQRSCDLFLGVPFNIASYALLLHLVARITNTEPDELILTLGDVHVYHTHFEAAREQLQREPMTLPILWIDESIKTLEDLDVSRFSDAGKITDVIQLQSYQSHSAIKAPMAV